MPTFIICYCVCQMKIIAFAVKEIKRCTIKTHNTLEYMFLHFEHFRLIAYYSFSQILRKLRSPLMTMMKDCKSTLWSILIKIFFVWRIKRFKADRENVSLIKSLPLLAFIFIALSSFIKNIFYTMYHLLTACTRVHVQIRVNLSIRW